MSATGVSSVIKANVDTDPSGSVADLSGFNHDINQRYEVLKQAKSDPTSKARKWLAKRQVKRARETHGDEAVGRDPRTGNIVYKTAASGQKKEGSDWNPAGTVVKADGYIRTIYDLLDLNYNFMPMAMGKSAGVEKADDPLLSTTTGVHNDVYGSDVFALLNSEQNLFGLLETRPWVKSGERVITDFGSSAASGGASENANLPDTVKPVFDTFETEPRTVVHTFDVSQVEQLLAATDDDAISDDPFALLRQWFGEGLPDQQTGGGEHPKRINQQLAQDADGGYGGVGMNTIDRAISNGEESSLYTNGDDNDIYGYDRSNNEFEANVIHNSGTTQVFHVDLLDDAIRQVKENSDKNPQKSPSDFVFITGHDTYQRIEDEFAGKERIEAGVRVTGSVNGIQTEPGEDVGVGVMSYKDIPIVETNDTPKDDISRIYLVDTSTLWIKMLLPTQFYSTGTEVGDGPFPLGRLGNEGAFVTIGELTLKNPKTQANIRDLE
jgi:hypothetical protein